LLTRIASPLALAEVEEIVNPFRSRVTLLTLILMAFPELTVTLFVR
jgi:hypothetical protein